MDNAINDLHYEIKFETCVKDKNNSFIKRNCCSFLNKNIFYSWRRIFFKIPMNLIASAFFIVEADIKKT